MAEVGFYHLTRSSLAEALPQLLVRTLAAGQRGIVLGRDETRLEELSQALWRHPNWLPHGTHSDGDAALQPIWLSTRAEPVNGARYLFLTEGGEVDVLQTYERVFDLFDGNDHAAVEAARGRWTGAKQAGHRLTYWQQTDSGWQKKG